MNIICNPIKVKYPYQYVTDPRSGQLSIYREAADPSMICYKGKYYIFASMTLSVWASSNLVEWKNYPLPKELPIYDYAPDVRIINDWVYFSTSKSSEICDFYRTKDIINGPYEKIDGTFPFWDPNLFQDDDGRIYFYWGCNSETPIWGVEVDADTMLPIGEKRELIYGDAFIKGFERVGENHSLSPRRDVEVDAMVHEFLHSQGIDESMIPKETLPMIRGMYSQRPFIEGAWMTKRGGIYYLQYACPGTEFNTYGDGVYVSDNPLGPFKPAVNNPYSYHPGGFMPGAGHGSTMEDLHGNWWHAATMRISVNHNFERRVGIWPAGFDNDGELFCNQRYGDWPREIESKTANPWANPKWMLLSYGKAVTASSSAEEYAPENICDENVKTWWQAKSNTFNEWIQIDLGKSMDVRYIQVNFADVNLENAIPGEIRGKDSARCIDENEMITGWILEGSDDGTTYFLIKDTSLDNTDYSHDAAIIEEGARIRYIRLSHIKVPYDAKPCVSGIRVFGNDDGQKPETAEFEVTRTSDLDMRVDMSSKNATGFNVLWGSAPHKLYHSYLVYGNSVNIGALIKGRKYFVRVDSFNESGITEGKQVLQV